MQATLKKTINKLSLEDLVELRDEVNKLIKQQQQTKRKELMAQYKELAAAHGMTIEDIVGEKSTKPTKRAKKVEVEPVIKYINFENPTQTWTGYGPKPKWLKELLAQGKLLEDFAI